MPAESSIQRDVAVGSRVGLHARPATLLAKAAAEQPAKVTITFDGKNPVDARSLLSLLALGARHNDVITLFAEGEGAEESINALADLIARDLDEAG
jgi:phosphocarrier protein HPr